MKSDHESGKEVEAEIKMAVHFYMQRRNNIPIITYDHKTLFNDKWCGYDE
ncbi:hypothetical protein IFO25_09670 [Campylobacter coli]|nr:hypothetical protein [Campylobacter coli]